MKERIQREELHGRDMKKSLGEPTQPLPSIRPLFFSNERRIRRFAKDRPSTI